MAHEVSAKLYTKVVAHKDLEIEVKTIDGGKPSKLGTLLISKGNRGRSLRRHGCGNRLWWRTDKNAR